MKRREFLTLNAALTAGALFLPVGATILCPPKKRKFFGKNDIAEPMEWFNENRHWLESWIDNAVPYNDFHPGMQIFKTVYSLYPTRETRYYKNIKERNLSKMQEHKCDLLLSGLFGIGGTRIVEKWRKLEENAHPVGSGYPPQDYMEIKFLDGFINQTGRYPVEEDKVRFVYLEGNGITRWLRRLECEDMRNIILSECRLEIL